MQHKISAEDATASVLIGRGAGGDKTMLLCFTVFFMGNSNFVKSKKTAYMFLQPAHFCKAEVQVEEDFEVAFGKLLSIPASDWIARYQYIGLAIG